MSRYNYFNMPRELYIRRKAKPSNKMLGDPWLIIKFKDSLITIFFSGLRNRMGFARIRPSKKNRVRIRIRPNFCLIKFSFYFFFFTHESQYNWYFNIVLSLLSINTARKAHFKPWCSDRIRIRPNFENRIRPHYKKRIKILPQHKKPNAYPTKTHGSRSAKLLYLSLGKF